MNIPIAAMLQARTGSSRLPGKVLLPIGGKPMIEQILRRINRSQLCKEFFLLTTERAEDDPVADIGTRLGVNVVRGSEDDVLDRFVTSLNQTEAEVIVRLTGDNPFVDGDLIDYMLAAFLAANPRADYANNIDDSGFPIGLSAEIVHRRALMDAHKCGHTAEDREHVTHFIRSRHNKYRLQTIHAPAPFSVTSLTIDTKEQYDKLAPLFERLQRKKADFGFYDLFGIMTEPAKSI